MLRVASQDGGFIVVATTLGPKGPKLQVGDFVAWQAGKLKEGGWVGVIIGTLKPELSNGRWLGDQKFST